MWGTLRSIALAGGVVTVLACPSFAVAVTAGSDGASAQAQVETVVLASGRNFPDALAGGILCAAYDAPMMLTEAHSLPTEVSVQIKTSGATRVIILGGEGAVGPEVVTALKGIGITSIDRIAGANRFATSAAVASTAATAISESSQAHLLETQRVVDDAIALVRAQIGALDLRLDAADERNQTLEARLDSVETSLATTFETTSTVRGSGLWPAEMAITVEVLPVLSRRPQIVTFVTPPASWWEVPVATSLVHVSYDGVETTPEPFLGLLNGDNMLVVYHIDGKTYTQLGANDVTDPPTEGAPIMVEYWFELNGQSVHGSYVVPGGWTYDRVTVP